MHSAEEWQFSQLSDMHDLNPGSAHTAYRHVALIELYLCTTCQHQSRPPLKWLCRMGR